ncbi:MAG TPA: DUF1385 domain-containing protein [Abditibacteriaceae bacterium]|jgi:uncharacterized protein YqhQ
MSDSDKKPFSLGGQALIEGVMMRSPHYIAAAVRTADGEIITRVERFDSVLTRSKFLRLPVLRGVVALAEMMLVGVRYLNWSGQVALQGQGESAPQAARDETAVEAATGAISAVLSVPVAQPRAKQSPSNSEDSSDA